LFLRDFQPFLSPDPLDPLGVHRPAGNAQQRRDAPIAVPTVGLGQRNDVGGQRRLVLASSNDLALRGAVLTEGGAGPTFGNPQLGPHLLPTVSATGGA